MVLWNPYRKPAEGDDTGALLVKEYSGHGYEIVDLCISHDNTRLASCGGDKCAFLWDTVSGSVLRKIFGHDQRLSCIAFSEESTVLLTGSHDKTVRLWDMKSSSRAPIQVLDGFKDTVTGVAALRGELVASCMDGSVRTYDLRTGRVAEDTLKGGVTTLAVSRDRNCLLAGSIDGGGELVLLDKATGTPLNRYTGHTNTDYRCRPTFTASDSHVVCGDEAGRVHFWDLLDPKKRTEVAAHDAVVSCVDVHPDPLVRVMATASFDGTAKIFAAPDQDLRSLTIAHDADDE